MKKIILILMLAGMNGVCAQPEDSGNHSEFEYKQIQTKFSQLEIADERLGLEIEKARTEGSGLWFQFWIPLVTSIVIPVLGFIVSVSRARKEAVAKVRAAVDQSVKSELETLVSQRIKPELENHFTRKIDKYFTDKQQFIMETLNDKEQLDNWRKGRKILIYCEDEKQEEDIRAEFKIKHKFERIETAIPGDKVDVEAFDLIVFNRLFKEIKYHKLSDEFIQSTVQDIKRDNLYALYLGTYFQGLDPENRKVGFANTRFTIMDRMKEIFRYQEL